MKCSPEISIQKLSPYSHFIAVEQLVNNQELTSNLFPLQMVPNPIEVDPSRLFTLRIYQNLL
jgi:hypothetical protein